MPTIKTGEPVSSTCIGVDFGCVEAYKPKTRWQRFLNWLFSTKWSRNQELLGYINRPFGLALTSVTKEDDTILVHVL